MKRKFKPLLVPLLLILFTSLAVSQEVYEVGVSQVSIEPGKELVSLALGGYAFPWEGRFSLQWKEKEKLPPFSAVAVNKGWLYRVDGNLLYKKDLSGSTPWKKVGKTSDVQHVAISGHTIWAITSGGQLLHANLENGAGKLKWKKSVSPGFPVMALTATDSQLFALDKEGSIWIAGFSSKKLKWSKTGFPPLEGVVSMAVVGKKLILLNSEGVLYCQQGVGNDHRWVKIAWKNGVTIREEIKTIVGSEEGLYGIDNGNTLFEGEHRSKGDLSARALSFKAGENRAVIVALDVTGINDSFTALVKEELFRTRGILPSSLFINSSHTHFSPVAQRWPTWQESNRQADSSWLYSTVRRAILKAVGESLDNAHPAELFFGRGKVAIGFNRRFRDHPEIYDDAVDVIRYQYLNGDKGGYLFMAACHPVHSTEGALHYTLSANFPGVARQLVEEKTGTRHALFLQGTAGDINPLDKSEVITGEKLADEVLKAANREMVRISGPISCYLDTVDFRINLKSKGEIEDFARAAKANKDQMLSERNQTWCDIMNQYHQEGLTQFSMPVYVHTVNIGNWKLVGFSRETTTPYSLGVKDLWPGKLVSVAGYTNDVSSYLPTHLHIAKKTYEGIDSFYWYGMPDTFPSDVENIIVTQVKKNNR